MRPFLKPAASLFVGLAMIAGTSSLAHADKVGDAIDKAKAFYDAGDLAKANARLQYAVGQIVKKLSARYAETFPAAPDGWTVSQRRRGANNGALFNRVGAILSKTYYSGDRRQRIRAQMIVDSPMLVAMTSTLGNPAMAQRMGYEQVDVDGFPQGILIKYNEDRRRAEAVAVVSGRIFIKLTQRNASDDTMVRNLMKSWKIDDLKKAVGIK